MLIIGPNNPPTNRPLIWMDRPCLHSKCYCNKQFIVELIASNLVPHESTLNLSYELVLLCRKLQLFFGVPGKLSNRCLQRENRIVKTSGSNVEMDLEGWSSRCHQLMELGSGSSEKCLEICKICPVASKSRREISLLGN